MIRVPMSEDEESNIICTNIKEWYRQHLNWRDSRLKDITTKDLAEELARRRCGGLPDRPMTSRYYDNCGSR